MRLTFLPLDYPAVDMNSELHRRPYNICKIWLNLVSEYPVSFVGFQHY